MITYVLLTEEDTIFEPILEPKNGITTKTFGFQDPLLDSMFEPIFGCKMVRRGGKQLESMYELQLSSEMKKCLRGSEILNDHPGLIEPQIADCNGEHPM